MKDSGNQQLLEKILAVNKIWREKCKELTPTLAISQTKSCLLKMRLNYLIIYLSRLEYVQKTEQYFANGEEIIVCIAERGIRRNVEHGQNTQSMIHYASNCAAYMF